jgi:hypothetical protein
MTNVFPREMLDADHAANFEKPWLLELDDGSVLQFDSEDAACDYQLALEPDRAPTHLDPPGE